MSIQVHTIVLLLVSDYCTGSALAEHSVIITC